VTTSSSSPAAGGGDEAPAGDRLAAVRALAEGWVSEPRGGRAQRQRASCGVAVLRALGDDVSLGGRAPAFRPAGAADARGLLDERTRGRLLQNTPEPAANEGG